MCVGFLFIPLCKSRNMIINAEPLLFCHVLIHPHIPKAARGKRSVCGPFLINSATCSVWKYTHGSAGDGCASESLQCSNNINVHLEKRRKKKQYMCHFLRSSWPWLWHLYRTPTDMYWLYRNKFILHYKNGNWIK